MRKKILSLLLMIFACVGLVACVEEIPSDPPQTKDTTPPEFLQLNDIRRTTLSTGTFDVYTGVTVSDDVDGPIGHDKIQAVITDVIEELEVESIPLDRSGEYLIEYTAWDKAGNYAIASRTVVIGNPSSVTDPTLCKAKGYIYDLQEVREDYKLVWNDEFDYEGLPDSTKWNYETGAGGWGNNETQYYTARNTAVSYANGEYLTINAINTGSRIESARLVTSGKASWKYGKIEARLQMATGQGSWPAFWMMPQNSVYGGWPASGEIDIMEHVGKRMDYVHNSLHMSASYGGTIYTNYGRKVENSSTEWHVYGLEWLPDRMMFYVDDTVTYTYSVADLVCADKTRWPFDQNFFVILNLAVGGNWGGEINYNDLPMTYKIDYVRVYQSEIITNLKQTA